MLNNILKLLFNKRLLFSIILHILHGFIFEKSKLYYPYTFDRNILLMRTDLYKYYLSTCFIFLSLPFLIHILSSNRYKLACSHIENRYRNRSPFDIQIGSYLLALSMILTGFCPSYLPIYLAINPILFICCFGTSYLAYTFYHVFGRLILNRINILPIHNNLHSSSKFLFDE